MLPHSTRRAHHVPFPAPSRLPLTCRGRRRGRLRAEQSVLLREAQVARARQADAVLRRLHADVNLVHNLCVATTSAPSEQRQHAAAVVSS